MGQGAEDEEERWRESHGTAMRRLYNSNATTRWGPKDGSWTARREHALALQTPMETPPYAGQGAYPIEDEDHEGSCPKWAQAANA